VGVVHHTNADGDHAIGVEVEGAFVPFVTLSGAKVAQHVERYNNLTERANEGDGQALAVLGSSYNPPSSSDSGLEGKTKPELLAIADEYGAEGVTSKSTKPELIAAIVDAGYEGEED
jgi:hypothetical protein